MSIPAHIISSSLIAATAAGVKPNEVGYLLASVVAAGIVDADHIFFIIRDWKMYRREGFTGNLHKARSFLHEFLGIIIMGIISLPMFFLDGKLGYIFFLASTLHIAQDMVVGTSIPFNPVDKTKMKLFEFNIKHKVLIDIAVIFISGILWLKFLSGQ